MEASLSYTFDDVVLVPHYSDVLPSEASVQTILCSRVSLSHPLMAAAMDTITESNMMLAFAKSGGLAILHKNMSIDQQVHQLRSVMNELQAYQQKQPSTTFFVNSSSTNSSHSDKKSLAQNHSMPLAAACGIEDYERIEQLVDAGLPILCIDSAHGHSSRVLETIKWTRHTFPNLIIMAGNIVTPEAATALALAGANIVKVGVGSGSICTTRIVSGVGVPQLTALWNVSKALKSTDIGIISDGGIRSSGDIVKALAAGAQAVMMGNMFAGTKETPGQIIEKDGKMYKQYRGMGSKSAMEKGSKDRYFQMGRGKLVPEGVEAITTYKGSVQNIIDELIGGLQSGMGYLGASNISILQQHAKWHSLTSVGLIESHPHDIILAHPHD